MILPEESWTAKRSLFLRIRLALPISLLILREKPTVLQSRRILKIQDSRVLAKSRKRSRNLCGRCDTHLVYKT